MTDTTHDFRGQHFTFPGRSRYRSEFPPDFLHGDATLDELYDAFGATWAERVAFVQYHVAPEGVLRGVSIAGFDDWFLLVEHATTAENGPAEYSTAELQRWVEARLAQRDLVVELLIEGPPVESTVEPTVVEATGEASPANDGATRGWIDVRCSIERLLQLEQEVLHVHREGGNDWITHAETNLLSLVTLCARLGLGLGE